MKQQQLREVSVPEMVSKALFLYRKRAKEGKTSRRISFPLPPHLLPPEEGVYETSLGEVAIKAVFKSAEGRWWVTVKLPSSHGFSLKDHIKQLPQQPPTSQQSSPFLSPEEKEELQTVIDRLWAK